jgi:hypothetical protein
VLNLNCEEFLCSCHFIRHITHFLTYLLQKWSILASTNLYTHTHTHPPPTRTPNTHTDRVREKAPIFP